jgi:23S rRNA pseudouridine1911/1915/1917 synthase
LWETFLKQTDQIISATPSELLVDEGEEPGPESDIRILQLGADQHGVRLDKALAGQVTEFSRSYLQQLLETGLVTLNGKVCTKVSQKVKAGDSISLELRPTPQSQAFKPEAVPFGIAYEDAHILVVNKLAHDPCFLLVPRAGIVHRLDKDTSGLMVVAKTREVMDALVKAIAAREVSRQYLALAHGPWLGAKHRTVDAAIGRDPRNRMRMAVVDLASQAGKTARTDFELIASDAQSCLVRCILHTGRTHQIRVHMASIAHPLVADSVYGGTPQFGLERQALHATRLAFVHPVSAKPVAWEAPLPPDMQQALVHFGPALQSAKA